jgi:hypothetical protein
MLTQNYIIINYSNILRTAYKEFIYCYAINKLNEEGKNKLSLKL